MKIRGRLTLSFSILIMIVLSVFGFITYKTFSESIIKNKDQIFAYKTCVISSKLNGAIDNCTDDIRIFSTKSNIEKLRKVILPSMRDDEALFIISKNGVSLLEVYSSKKNSFESLDIKETLGHIKTSSNSDPTTYKSDNFYAFSSFSQPTGWNLTYIVPKNVYLNDLIIFKNRIIVAIVIIMWLSVWVVLIISYGISKPLMILSKAAKDITALNYETPIKISRTKDEIEDLANSFEFMRLKIKDLILKDPLTDIYNRRYLMQFLESEVSKANRLESPLSVIMIDIDHFKDINDTYGHHCGDDVLRKVGQTLNQMVREYDVVARYGGEEFAVILPNTGLEEAYATAERLRKGIESIKCMGGAEAIITISIGLSSYDKEIFNTPEKLIHSADVALYQAKEAGRNRTIIYRA